MKNYKFEVSLIDDCTANGKFIISNEKKLLTEVESNEIIEKQEGVDGIAYYKQNISLTIDRDKFIDVNNFFAAEVVVFLSKCFSETSLIWGDFINPVVLKIIEIDDNYFRFDFYRESENPLR